MSPAKPRILIVDDEPEILFILGETFNSEDFEVCTSPSGANKALELIAHKTFDVILTDIQLSDMSGLQLIQNILKEKKTELAPLIAVLTGYLDQNKDENRASGIDLLFNKPQDLPILVSTIKEALSKRNI